MDSRSRFSSIRRGVDHRFHQSRPRALTYALCLLVTLAARPALAAAPPPIEKQGRDAGQSAKVARQFIPGLPLGPYQPDRSGIRVGFIDSGIDPEHPQLEGLVVGQKDFTGEGLADSSGHGTAVALRFVQSWHEQAGTLHDAGLLQGESGRSSPPPFYMAKVTGRKPADSQQLADRMVAAIRWLAEAQVTIVNISMALPEGVADYSALCDEMGAQEKMFFGIAAGNAGPDSVVYPAACKQGHKIVTGALNRQGEVAEYSGPADLVAPANVTRVSEAHYFLQEGDRLAQAGSLDSAHQSYERAMAADPTTQEKALIEYGLGYIAMQRGQTQQALASFQRSALGWPQYAEPYVAIGALLGRSEDFEKAREWLALGIESGAESARLHDRYARVLLDLDRPAEALQQVDALLALDPSFEGVRILRQAAQNLVNVENYLEQGIPPETLLDAFLNAGDDAQLVGFLVRKSGMNPNAVLAEQGIPLLVRAAALDRYWSSLALLQQGADVNASMQKLKVSALMLAASNGNLKLAAMLMRKGATLDQQDYLGFTPLMFAAEGGHLEVVKHLLDSGADPRPASQEGKTAYDYADQFGHAEVAQLLQQHLSVDKD